MTDISIYEVFTGPDSDVIAKHLREAGKKAKKRKIPEKVQLVEAITGVTLSDTIQGSSTLSMTLVDPDYALLESGFFDCNKDGKLDAIDVEYPENSNFWWRLTQLGLSDSSGAGQLTLTFMERAAAHLAQHHGPMKVARGKRTRAEFLKLCAKKVKAGGGIDFHSRELHKKQKKEKPEAKPETGGKDSGINKDVDLTVKGSKASKEQINNADTGLKIAQELDAPEKACLALLVAFIQESTMQNLNYGDADSLGILQVRVSTSGSAAKSRDVAWCSEKFLKDGFWGKGGAIELAKKNPGQPVGWIAQQAQGSAYPDAYQPHVDEAKAFLEAFGGPGWTGTSGATLQYNFEIGTAENPNEDLWAGMNRIAEEVKWCLFINGQDLFYDSELTLIKQQPALVLRRGSPALITYEFNWDHRQIATDLSVDLVCDPFEFRAGQVFQLVGFGPASTGSTAKPPLPGRWLISDIERDLANVYSRFTLKQPERPLKEPANEQAQGDDASTGSGPVRDRIVQVAKDSVRPFFYSQSGALTAEVHPNRGQRSDCSQWARACYLTAGAGDPGTYTGDMLARGKTTHKPKPGDLLCSPSHVELFIGDGKTIGHGSDPIDGDTVQAVRGRDSSMRFITYDFLD